MMMMKLMKQESECKNESTCVVVYSHGLRLRQDSELCCVDPTFETDEVIIIMMMMMSIHPYLHTLLFDWWVGACLKTKFVLILLDLKFKV